MKKISNLNLKISADYLIICAIITICVIVISITSIISIYKNSLKENKQFVKQRAIKAENAINDTINEHSWQIRSISNKIMKSNNDIKKISQIIIDYNKLDSKSNFEQFLNQKNLFWVDQNYNIIVKNKIGILKYPQKITKEYQISNSKDNLWQLEIADNLPYFYNGYSLIPTSFGVTDNNGNYLGTIASSIDIHLISNLIEPLSTKNIDIAILSSSQNKIIFQSNKNLVKDIDFFTYKLGNINYQKNDEGYLEKDISKDNFRYFYYRKITNYPLVILIGYDKKQYQIELITTILKEIYPNFIIGIILMIVMFLFYKRIVQPINLLSKFVNNPNSKNKLPKTNSPEIFGLSKAVIRIKNNKLRLENSNLKLTKATKQLEDALEQIKKSELVHLDIVNQIKQEIAKNTYQAFKIIKILKYDIENQQGVSRKTNLYLINSLESELTNITKFATDEISRQYVNIYDIIQKVILSQEKAIRIRNIAININYHKALPKKIFVDEIRLIQILSGILHKTINILFEGNIIDINIKPITKNKIKNISIKIKDNGVGIGFKDHINNLKKFGKIEEHSITGIDISLETIEELVKLHMGKIIYNNILNEGSITEIIIPLSESKTNDKPLNFKKKLPDNVLFFPLKK